VIASNLIHKSEVIAVVCEVTGLDEATAAGLKDEESVC